MTVFVVVIVLNMVAVMVMIMTTMVMMFMLMLLVVGGISDDVVAGGAVGRNTENTSVDSRWCYY